MVVAVLGTEFNVLKTEKNFNNEIGLPKTLLRLTAEHEALLLKWVCVGSDKSKNWP